MKPDWIADLAQRIRRATIISLSADRGRTWSNTKLSGEHRDELARVIEKGLGGWNRMDAVPVPTNEMFIWAAPNGPGRWSLGLAYRNVSGGWSDAYGDQTVSSRATRWCAMPAPPQE